MKQGNEISDHSLVYFDRINFYCVVGIGNLSIQNLTQQ